MSSRRFDGSTALHLAAANGHEEVLKQLLIANARIDTRDNNGATALHQAAIQGHENALRVLVSQGADVNARDDNGRTPLVWAIIGEYQDAAKAQVSSSTKKASASKESNSTLQRYKDAFKVLLDANADMNAQDKCGRTVLFWAAYRRPEFVQLLLDAGADMEGRDNLGRTALHCASSEGTPDVIKVLLNGKASVTAEDKEGRTPLLWAVVYGRLEAMTLLMNANAASSSKDRQWMSDLTMRGLNIASIITSNLSLSEQKALKAELAKCMIKIRPGDYICHRQVARVYCDEKRFKDALALFDACIILDPSNKTITHISEIVHSGSWCDDCGIQPIHGVRFKCLTCTDFDLCQACFEKPIQFGHQDFHHEFLEYPSQECIDSHIRNAEN